VRARDSPLLEGRCAALSTLASQSPDVNDHIAESLGSAVPPGRLVLLLFLLGLAVGLVLGLDGHKRTTTSQITTAWRQLIELLKLCALLLLILGLAILVALVPAKDKRSVENEPTQSRPAPSSNASSPAPPRLRRPGSASQTPSLRSIPPVGF
jgi:hypothetical protein